MTILNQEAALLPEGSQALLEQKLLPEGSCSLVDNVVLRSITEHVGSLLREGALEAFRNRSPLHSLSLSWGQHGAASSFLVKMRR